MDFDRFLMEIVESRFLDGGSGIGTLWFAACDGEVYCPKRLRF